MRILLIEDHRATRELLRLSLERKGHRVEGVESVAAGRHAVAQDAFDVLVIDIELPDGSGLELCSELRRSGNRTPILMLTARGEVAQRVAGLEAGADDYLRKPFALAELYARLDALQRRGGPRPPDLLGGTGWSIDFARRCFLGREGEIALTAREWRILEYVAARRGQLVPREELLESVWGSHTRATSDSLDVIVGRLRRKLAALSPTLALRTVRGEGFILDVPS